MDKIELMATSTFGMEALVKKEINDLGYEITEVKNGRITFIGDLQAIARANLWLRTAERVLVKIGDFEARDFDQLYDGVKDLNWSQWLPENAEFPVSAKSISSKLNSVPTCQSVTKKAIVDSMKEDYGTDWFDEDGPLYPIELALYKDRAILTIDSSGTGLHKRGYRELSVTAPIQETIAAGMVYLSRWDQDRILIDPFCGSGTILIEAAMMAKNQAPGLKRKFNSEKWPIFDDFEWPRARVEAKKAKKINVEPRLIMGYDYDPEVISIARYHAQQAGVDDIIHFQEQEFKDFSTNRKYGYIITNPPYGERMGEKEEVEELYKLMGEKFLELETWSYYIITSHSKFEKIFGKEASKRRKLYNGGVETQYYQYYGPWPPKN
ncbi:FIG001721: Predicted N6-adenine-specific DNA methylase [Halanaerobium saccharolyticum subsp. saccharolyticum DSM 6643]|uniref:FIG001721: Predicted N6-adenine-specific DNA methylase n=1 Tax=Halanaerobium saccharolyticum subsp. saccharolyticum DSM 6643 TaxID=1293054 RepID=M5EDS0_9FIRM|nr:class I SAM-dependent RNA methyltransferase [Halanaerobium saccharolyticum]CCU79216.1 FIG001721: Predicted N6-adenine-specific DNA methylase [Halanaerobium saccharolyticum subsp. saccharolyticum DSM 6643]